ncbi:DNA polymerase III subunit alpha, partial [Desulfomarina sp.]
MTAMFLLGVRSSYSLLRGTASPGRLCRLVKKLGYTGIGLADRDNLYGLWDFLRGCRDEGLCPIIGAQITEPGSPDSVICLVKNGRGYRSLCALLTDRHCKKHFSLTRGLPVRAEGLIVLCREPGLLKEFCSGGVEVAADLGGAVSAQGRILRQLAGELGVPAVVTADCDAVGRDDFRLACLLRAVRKGVTIGDARDGLRGMEQKGIVSSPEFSGKFAIWPEVIRATAELAARCRFTGPDFGVVMPPWCNDRDNSPVEALRREAYRGARRRYGDDLGEPVIERLEHELRIIEQMGFSSYFLVVRDIVHPEGKDGRRKKRRICGRGSGAASLVAYCLEITNVCPLKYNLYFERFLNPERSDPPDIDIDFAWDERDEVLDEILQKFREHAAMVCNHVFFKPRMAIRETARAFGLPDHEISEVTGRLPWVSRNEGEGLETRLRALASFRGKEFLSPWPEILELAEELVGLPRCLSVHPGGVVITPGPINSYVPVEYAAKGVPVIQWEKDGTEKAGLVKIDILGNRSLGVIRDCVKAINENGQILQEEYWQPEDDEVTRQAIGRGETMGCFYIESPAMRLLQKKAGRGDFEQLVIQSSIIRPAANEFVREYVRRLHGGDWQPLCDRLGDVLDETYGLMVYQEDVSRVAVAMAGFSHGEADGLRKIMSKKDRERRLKHYRDRFFKGCAENNVAQEDREEMWRMMMSFDGYSFCKPHSASYARVSFQAAWLKCHFPAEFMAAVISNRGGYYSTFAYVSEAKRLGLKICHPDVRHSEIVWVGKNDWIRVGLQELRGLSSGCMERIVMERKKCSFTSISDFFCRINPADNEVSVLVHGGALDGLAGDLNRSELLWQWAGYQAAGQNHPRSFLFPVVLPSPPSLPAPNEQTRLRREFAALGFLCDIHPLECVARQEKNLIKGCDLDNYRGQQVNIAAWLLTGKLVSTKSGEVMEFLTFEDETALFETTFFPQIYRRYASVLSGGRPYVLSGLVDEDYG